MGFLMGGTLSFGVSVYSATFGFRTIAHIACVVNMSHLLNSRQDVKSREININIYIYIYFFFLSQWWCLLSPPLLPSLQLLVNSEDAGASLAVLADQETSKVLFVELLKPHTGTGTRTGHDTHEFPVDCGRWTFCIGCLLPSTGDFRSYFLMDILLFSLDIHGEGETKSKIKWN